MDNLINQIEEGKRDKDYHYHCCGTVFDSLYDFRKHLFEKHAEEYPQLEPLFHRELPPKKEGRGGLKALKRKEKEKKKRRGRMKSNNNIDYSKQPFARILYHGNGRKR